MSHQPGSHQPGSHPSGDPATEPTPPGGAGSGARRPAGPAAGQARPSSGDPSIEEERELIRRAQAGEEAAFAELVHAHQRRAFGIARSLVASEEDARDLAQEAFLRVFKNLERFDFRHPFATWLHRIVTNLAIDHLRKRRLVLAGSGGEGDEGGGELELEDESQELPSDRLEAIETAALVREVIESLAPHFQRVLVLRELEGLACTEIAEIVGATHVTVRWRLHRGRKLFQEEWERRQRLTGSASPGKSRSSANTGGNAP